MIFRLKYFIAVSVFFGLCVSGVGGWAEEAAPAPEDLGKKMEELQRKVDILTDEIQDMKVEMGTAEPVVEYKSQLGLAPAASKVYGVKRGLSLGGYGEIFYQKDLREAGSAEVNIERLVLYTGYKFTDKILFNSEVEYEDGGAGEDLPGEVVVEFAYLDFMLRPEINVRAGNVLMPIGFINEIHEPPFYHGVQRPRTERVILPATWHEEGVGLWGRLPKSFDYRLYVTNSLSAVDEERHFSASSGIRGGRQDGIDAHAKNLALTGRLDYSGVQGLLVGGSFFIGNSGQGTKLADGSDLEARVFLWDTHAQYNWKGFEFRGLYAEVQIDDKEEINQILGLEGNQSVGDLRGWYLQAAYDLGTKMLVQRNFYLAPFVRWEQYDTQSSVPAGYAEDPANEIQDVVAGLTFKPNPVVAIKMDYTSRTDDNGHGKQTSLFNLGLGFAF